LLYTFSLNEIPSTTADESLILLCFAITSFDEFASANEKNIADKDTISAKGKRCFFMVIGGFSIIGTQMSEEKMGWKKNKRNTKKILRNSLVEQSHSLFQRIVQFVFIKFFDGMAIDFFMQKAYENKSSCSRIGSISRSNDNIFYD
jgi:uncharacterized membrane protein YbjE (DUF340 family)